MDITSSLYYYMVLMIQLTTAEAALGANIWWQVQVWTESQENWLNSEKRIRFVNIRCPIMKLVPGHNSSEIPEDCHR